MPGPPWQVRQTALEIDLALLKKNYQRLQKRARGAELLALLKSDAYGHSLPEVARFLDALPANSRLHGFGVANVEEGIELRRSGAKRPIYVLSGVQYFDQDLFECLCTVRLTPVISSLDVLKQVSRVLRANGEKLRAHLKFNSGMNRLGIDVSELEECLKVLKNTPGLEVHGILSHFATAETLSSALTRRQIKRFREIAAAMKQAGHSPHYLHMQNSAGLENQLFPEGNLARVGLHLYGLDDKSLSPVAKWTAQVYQVRTLRKGETVGYGARFRAKKPMRMAVLGVGYGDGYRRIFSNRAEVLVKGRRCRVIGSVSMDLTAIDVTGVPSIKPRDRAVLLGRDGREEITASELARHGETISYEILTGITKRVPRVFLHG